MVIHLLIYFYTNEKLNKNVKQNDDEEWKTGGWWEGMSTESKRCTHATIYILLYIYVCMMNFKYPISVRALDQLEIDDASMTLTSRDHGRI